MTTNYKEKYKAALHEIRVWQRECSGREGETFVLYRRLKRLCKLLVEQGLPEGWGDAHEIRELVNEVNSWPEFPSDSSAL